MQKHFFVFGIVFIALLTSFQSSAKDGYIPGQVVVKLKPAFAYLNADGKGMRSKPWSEIVPSLSVYKNVAYSMLEKPGMKSRKVNGTGETAVDLRLYHQINFDPAIPVQDAIQQLYASGIVEIAEPAYTAKSSFVPNDPLLGQQYHIALVNALKAWDISKSNENIIIAILDSGVDLDHPDLLAHIYRNEADGPEEDGIDNDGDGFIDNYWGWDFAGDDFATLEWDNDPNAELENINHGTMVAGCASAVTNNGIGVAGLGFNAQLMILKHSADNDTRDDGAAQLNNLLLGVVYAANHGAHIINASYGSIYFSQIAQDIYQYAAQKDVLIIAAAGNENSPEPHYPSDYDLVLSVAATTATDRRATFSNYGYKVDLSAPGTNIFTTQIGGDYGVASGTSFAAPIVAGAAALARAQYPELTGIQIGELIRITADPAFRQNLSESYKNVMGRGRLDAYRALVETLPSIRYNSTYVEADGEDVVKAGDEATLIGIFTNFLWPATNAQVTLSTDSEYITILEGTVNLGTMGSTDSVSNENNPFRFKVGRGIPANTVVNLRLDYTADNYTDYQYLKVLVNPSYFNVNENLIATSIASNGRIGYQDPSQTNGIGFVYNDVNMLYELGVIMAVGEDKVVSNVRSVNQGFDDDLAIVDEIVKDNPGAVSDVDVYGSFDDSKAVAAEQLNVEVDFWGFVWREVPYEKMIIMEYEVTNTGNNTLNNFYFGLYADWDINQLEGKEGNDLAGWDGATQTGYVYTPSPTERWVGAIQLLSEKPNYYAIDNNQDLEGNPLGVYDGYTDAEKYLTLSSGIGRAEAGIMEEGNDVSHTVASGPYSIQPGESVRIAFALHGASSIDEVLTNAVATNLLYESIDVVSRPEPNNPVGLYDQEIAGLKVYPNPSSGTINLEMAVTAPEPLSIKMFDLSGRALKAYDFPPGVTAVQLKMPERSGMYLLEIVQGNKRSIRKVINK